MNELLKQQVKIILPAPQDLQSCGNLSIERIFNPPNCITPISNKNAPFQGHFAFEFVSV
jgi:hypothetical protein